MGHQPAAPYAFGQLFSKDTQAIFYNFKLNPIQVSSRATETCVNTVRVQMLAATLWPSMRKP
jgi:hypothetical protein